MKSMIIFIWGGNLQLTEAVREKHVKRLTGMSPFSYGYFDLAASSAYELAQFSSI